MRPERRAALARLTEREEGRHDERAVDHDSQTKDQEWIGRFFEISGVITAHRLIARARDHGAITAAGTPRKVSAATSPK